MALTSSRLNIEDFFFSQLDVITRGTRSEIITNIFLDGVGCPIFTKKKGSVAFSFSRKMLAMLNHDEKYQNQNLGLVFFFSTYLLPV